jgi:hypothetical protein
VRNGDVFGEEDKGVVQQEGQFKYRASWADVGHVISCEFTPVRSDGLQGHTVFLHSNVILPGELIEYHGQLLSHLRDFSQCFHVSTIYVSLVTASK